MHLIKNDEKRRSIAQPIINVKGILIGIIFFVILILMKSREGSYKKDSSLIRVISLICSIDKSCSDQHDTSLEISNVLEC